MICELILDIKYLEFPEVEKSQTDNQFCQHLFLRGGGLCHWLNFAPSLKQQLELDRRIIRQKIEFLKKQLVEIGKEKNFRTLVSRIAGKSEASVHLHKKLGFSNIGTMKKVGKTLVK